MALTKKYKPGQLITINNRVYRVCNDLHSCWICSKCDLKMCLRGCTNTIGLHGYLKLIKL